eukprot:5436267-Amphidinium_carterae.1
MNFAVVLDLAGEVRLEKGNVPKDRGGNIKDDRVFRNWHLAVRIAMLKHDDSVTPGQCSPSRAAIGMVPGKTIKRHLHLEPRRAIQTHGHMYACAHDMHITPLS